MFEISNYRPFNKNALMGTFDVKIPKWGNFLIKRMSYFKKDSNSWINFPQESYMKDDKKKYFSLNGFEDLEMQTKFLEGVRKALEAHLETLDQQRVTSFEQKGKIDNSQESLPF